MLLNRYNVGLLFAVLPVQRDIRVSLVTVSRPRGGLPRQPWVTCVDEFVTPATSHFRFAAIRNARAYARAFLITGRPAGAGGIMMSASRTGTTVVSMPIEVRKPSRSMRRSSGRCCGRGELRARYRPRGAIGAGRSSD